MAQSNSDASLLRHWLPPWCQLAQSHYDTTQVIADGPLGIDVVTLLGALKSFDSAAIYIEIHSTIQASRPYPVRVTVEASFLTAPQNSRLYECNGQHESLWQRPEFDKAKLMFQTGAERLGTLSAPQLIHGHATQSASDFSLSLLLPFI